MATPLWPIGVLPPRNILVDLAPRSLSGPVSISGRVQVVSTDAGIWKAIFDQVPVHGDSGILAWRGISMLCEGRLNPILVPFPCGLQAPIPDDFDPGSDDLAWVPHSDDTPHDDGAGYYQSSISVTLVNAIAPRATTATLHVNYAGTLQPGMTFSIGERMYRIRTATYTDDQTVVIAFRPPMREAALPGTNVEFEVPVCRMKLATDDQMDLALEYGLWSFPSVSFVEDV